MKQPDRYAVELDIFGLLDALVKSKAVEVNILEHHVLVQRFFVSNHIRRRRRVCMTKCG